MGSTGISDFFHTIHGLFKSSDMTAIVTTGAQVEGLETVVGKLYLENFIDGDLVMEACDLVVCHGGNGTIYQALQHGKPVIGIPTIPDQNFNMRRVEALGVGKMLTWREFINSPASLLEMIRTTLHDDATIRYAARFQEKLKNYDAAKTAAGILTAP
jgi:UDP:flavonoid glycosyltransferase YjiC (YdhE family)